MPENDSSHKGFSKKVLAIIITAVLIVGGGVVAFFLITGTPKTAYFKAEKATADFIGHKMEERYQPEMDWAETVMEHAAENTVELSAQYNGPPLGGSGMSPGQIINSSSVTMTSQLNQDDNQLATDLEADIGGIQIDDIQLFADSDNLFLQLPFLDETLTIQDSDLSELLQEADPDFEGAELDFKSLFEQMDGALSEDDQDYLMEEYPGMV